MVKLKHKDIRTIDDAFGMHGGYVLNFSDRTFSEFFEDEFGLDIDDDRYDLNGTSKAKRLRTLFSLENDFTVAKVLRELWAYRETLPAPQGWDKPQSEDGVKARLFDLIRRIEGNSSSPRMGAFDKFAADETLEELIAAIERDIQANKPGSGSRSPAHLQHEEIGALDRKTRGVVQPRRPASQPHGKVHQTSRAEPRTPGDQQAGAEKWLLEYADCSAGQRQVVLALVDVASGESLALTSGSREGVWITGRAAHWLARPGRRLWTMHNHPEGRSASPCAVLPSLLDVHMLAHPAIETVEACTTHGLLSATTAGPV